MVPIHSSFGCSPPAISVVGGRPAPKPHRRHPGFCRALPSHGAHWQWEAHATPRYRNETINAVSRRASTCLWSATSHLPPPRLFMAVTCWIIPPKLRLSPVPLFSLHKPFYLKHLPYLGHESFAAVGPLALLGNASYPVLVHRPADLLHASSPLSRPHAVALRFTHRDQLVTRLAPVRVRPCWAHQKKGPRINGGQVALVLSC